MPTPVSQAPAADAERALQHFQEGLRFETDCWDVHASMASGADFVLLDVRSAEHYARAHVPGAISLPHAKIIEGRLRAYPQETLFVVYCAGPHCNGAQKAAIRLAALKRPVKLMIGGMTGWLDEGFEVARGEASAALPT
jgi:rhodanese-related sulfurtransferase